MPDINKGLEYLTTLQDQANRQASADFNISRDTPYVPYSEYKDVNFDRYGGYLEGVNQEDFMGRTQGSLERAKNGVLKGVGLAATTFVGGTAGLIYGASQWIKDGRFASLYDNEVFRGLDEVNTSMEDSLPNFYTNKEINADWYTPSNLFTANFVFDKLIKNAGFFVGAIGGGMAWTKALSIVGKAMALTKAGQSIKPLVTALEEANTIADPIQRASKIASITEGMSLGENITLGAMKAGANSNRIITSLMGTFGEAGIESLQALNTQRKELIDQYTSENGFAPTGDALTKINEFADRTGNTVFALNSALLTGTNYIQLPKILGSKYGASKLVSNGVEKELNALTRETSGEVVTAFSKMSKPARILTKTKNALGVVFSPSESFEEGSQFAISEGVGNYYKKKYEDPKGQLGSFLGDLAQGTLSEDGASFGVNRVFNTKEGMESLLLGGLSGGLMQSGIISRKGIGKTGELGQRGFFGQGGERGKNTQEAIVALNKSKISEALADQARTQNAGINIAKEQAEALKQNDRYSFKNSEADYTFNYLQSRIKYGKIDWVLEDVKQYKTLAATEEGFETLKQQGVAQETQTKEEFLQNLNKLEQDAKFVNETYKRVNLSYGGKVSSKSVAFTPEHLEALTYLQYKMKDISDRSGDLTAKVGQYGISITDYIQEFIDKKELSNESLEKFEKELKANTRIPDDVQDEVIDNFTSVLKLEKDYKNFLEEYNEITKNPGYLTEQLKTMNDLANKNTDTDTVPATVQLTSVLGEQRFNLNQPYSILEEDAEKFGLPKSFTVVQENPDGTLIIKDRLGKRYSVSKEALAPFRFAKNAEVTGDKKGTFLYTVTPEEIEQKKKEDAFLADAKKVNEVLKENENIEIASGDVITSDATTTTGEIEPAKKTASAYFHTSKEPTIEDNNLTGMAKKRQNLFYAIKKSSRKFVAAFVTPALQEKLNLPNVLDLLYDADKVPGNHADDSTGKATIGQVYLIEAPSGDLYYTDEDGNPLKRADNSFIKFGDVLTEQEKQKLVLSVSPSLEAESARGPVYRSEEKEEFYKNLELYKQERKDLLAITDTDQLPIHKVAISKGFLISKDVEGNFLPGVHVSNLITEEVIKTKSDVITVPRADGVTNLPTGEQRKVKAGFPMLNFGGQLYNLNNRQLTTKEKETIKGLLVALASRFQFGNRKLDRTILSYIQHILYYGQGKSETFKNNQIAIVQEEDRTAIPTIKDGVEVYPKPFFLKMGPNKVKFDKASVNSVEGLAAIDTFLNSAYTNVNIKTIDAFANDKFVEITGIAKDKDGNLLENKDGSYRLETLTWPNYRTFLLSSKKPDGKARPVEETPLTIKMITPQEGVKETPIVDQYAIFTDKKFKEPAPAAKTEVALSEEVVPYPVENFNKIKEAIKNEAYDEYKTEKEKLTIFFEGALATTVLPENMEEQVALRIARYNLTKQQQEATTITSEFGNIGIMDFDPTDTGAPFEEAIVSETDIQIANIERRRQEELDNLFSKTQASTDKQLNTPVQKLSKEEINRNIETAKQQNKDLIEELEKEFKENTDNKASDEVWDKWDKKSDKLDNNLPQGVSFRITDGKVDFFDNQSYREKGFGKNIVQVSVDNLHNKTEKFEVGDNLQVQDGVRALPAKVTKVNEHGKILEAKQEDGRIIISRGNIITLAPINDRLKINAKYDAELKALEQQPTSTAQSESNPALRDVESTAKALDAKKADIERRRQEELDSNKSTIPKAVRIYKGVDYNGDSNTAEVREMEDGTLQIRVLDENGKRLGVINTYPKGVSDESAIDGVIDISEPFEKSEQSLEEARLTGKKDKINAKYDAELTALGQSVSDTQVVEYKGNSYTVDMTAGTVTNSKGKVIKSTSPVGKKVLDLVNWEDSEEKTTEPITPEEAKDLNKIDSEVKNNTGIEGEANIEGLFRREFSSNDKPMSNTDWAIFRQWAAEKLPNMPIHELEEMIRIMGTDRKAWGMLKDNALHIFKYAPKGTEYHEAFEFVWNRLLSIEQQAEIIAELKMNEGLFFDIITESKVKFSEATTEQLKEFAAERFASYKKGGETVFEKLNNFFSKVMAFIKNFFVGNKFVALDQLFTDIQSGKFKNATINNSTNTAFKKAPRLTELETKSLVDTGYVLFLMDISKNGPKGVYTLNSQKITDEEIITSKLKERLGGILVPDVDGNKIPLPESKDTFDAIVNNVKSKLKSLGISFEKTVEINPEEEDQTINDEGRNKNDYTAKEMKVDHRKGAFPIIKLAYSKLYETIKIKATKRGRLEKAKPKMKAGNSLTPVDFGKSFITVMKTLSPVLQLDKVNKELINLAKKDSNFTRLLQDLGFDFESQSFNYEGFDHYQWQQSIQHFVTFAKQNPTAVNFITTEGNVTMQNAVLQRPTELIKNQWLTNIKVAAKGEGSPISFNVKTNKFSLNSEINNKYQDLQNLTEAKEYLATLGIIFSDENILDIAKDNNQTALFLNTARDINKYLMPEENFKITPDTLSVGGPIQKLAELHVNLNTENFNSTYYTLSGTSKQQFDNHNFPSKFEVAFNSATTREELYKMMPHLKDSLAKNSIFLRENDAEFTNEYWNENGERTDKVFKISIFNEIKDNDGNVKTQDSLDLNERVTYQINNLLNENHYIILPADSATEWMTTFNNPISIKAILDNTYDSILANIFKGYLQDEIAVASEHTHRSKNENVSKNGAKDLRILKDMLSEDLLVKVAKVINEEVTFDEFWAENQEQFKTEIISHLQEKRENVKQLLIKTGEVTSKKEGDNMFYSYPNLDDNYRKSSVLSSGYDKNKMTEEDLNALLDYFSINYALSNIELFKILFGDPYQFKIATKKNGLKVYDVFKRIKSWLSPRRTLFTDSRFDAFANDFYNTVTTSTKERAIRLEPKDLGHNTFSHLKTSATIALSSKNGEDVVGSMVMSELFKYYEELVKKNPKFINPLKDFVKITEADASSGITIMKYREIKIKTGQWDFDTAEVWYQQEMAYARQQLAKKGKYTYTSSRLKNSDEELARLRKPTSPEFITDVLKPIITGPKESAGYNEQELDKTSMMPIFYSMTEVMSYDEETRKDVPASTILQDLFLAMVENNVDYYTFPSGKKVGITDTHYVYNEDGSFNTEIFKDKSITVAPLDNLGIQVETMYQGGEGNTVGSQATKVISMDLLVGGYPSDAKVTEEEWAQLSEEERENNSSIYKLIRLNDKYRRDLVLNGYQSLLNRFGIQDLGDRFEVENIEGLQETIVQELERRNLSDNALSSLELEEEKNKFKANLEASNFYGVIKDVLWSIVRKNIVQPTVSGMQAVQIPVAFFESSIEGKTLLQKTEDGYKTITREEYNTLTEEQQKNVKFGSSALSFYTETVMQDGVTKQIQGMEVMLPMWFRDTIKSHKRYGKASDAEILNFLNETEEGKSILQGLGFRIPTQGLNSIEVFKVKAFLPKAMGKSIVVPSEITTKAGSDFDIDKLNTYLYNVWVRNVNKVATITKVKALNRQKEEIDPSSEEAYEFFLNEALFYQNNVEDDLINTLSLEQKALYFQKQAIENKYFETMQQMLLLPENYEKILTPNTTKDLESLSEELADVLGENSVKVVSPLIDFTYIVKMRDAFLTGKKWVGVVATNITGHSLFQKFNAYVDLNRIQFQSAEDKKYLKDGIINLPHNTVNVNGKEMTSLSKVKNKSGALISDILSQFANAVVDIAKDPFITKIISSKFTIGPAMFLVRAGVDLKTIGYFLNQPIVREYLENLSQSRTKTVFSEAQIANTLTQFETNGPKADQKMSSAAQLKDNIKQYYVSGVTDKDSFNREQRYILEEFLKYAKLAEYNFKITQATNYDTASFRSGDVLYKKELLYKEAQTNMISSAKEMLDATFVGEMRENLNNAQSMMGSIFKTETPFVRNYINRLLNPYALGFTGEEDYLKISIKLSSSLIDYLVITKSSLLKGKFNALFSGPNNIWSRIQEAKAKGISNLFFDYIEGVVSDNVNGSTSLKLTVNKKDVYEQNQLADALRELKEQDINLYRDVVSAAILQGSAVSPFSFTDMIPIEDYVATVNPIIENITEADLKTYVEENAFQRNNWSDSTIVSKVKPSISVVGLGYFDEYGNEFTETTINNFPNDLNSIINSVNNLDTNTLNYGKNPLLLHRSSQDVIVMNRYQYKEKSYFDMVTGGVDTTIRERLKQNDPSTKEIMGYQKVKNEDGYPLVVNNKYVFKAINLKGLGIQGNDYENLTQPSSINNNTYTVKTELPNSAIISYYINNKPGTAYIEMPKQLEGTNEFPNLDIKNNIEIFNGFWTRAQVAKQTDKVFLFGDNTEDRLYTKYVPSSTQAVIRGLPNAIGIDTKRNRRTEQPSYGDGGPGFGKVLISNGSYFTDEDFEEFKEQVDLAIQQAKNSGKTIVIPGDGIGTGKAMLKEKAPKLFEYLQQELNKLQSENKPENEFLTSAVNNSISTFFNSLNAQQQAKLGSLENLQNEYNAVPFAISEEDFINELKCKL